MPSEFLIESTSRRTVAAALVFTDDDLVELYDQLVVNGLTDTKTFDLKTTLLQHFVKRTLRFDPAHEARLMLTHRGWHNIMDLQNLQTNAFNTRDPRLCFADVDIEKVRVTDAPLIAYLYPDEYYNWYGYAIGCRIARRSAA